MFFVTNLSVENFGISGTLSDTSIKIWQSNGSHFDTVKRFFCIRYLRSVTFIVCLDFFDFNYDYFYMRTISQFGTDLNRFENKTIFILKKKKLEQNRKSINRKSKICTSGILCRKASFKNIEMRARNR